MLTIKVLLRFFDTGFIKKNLLVLLLFALIPFFEILFFFYLGDLLGIYLILASAAVTGLIGFFLSFLMIKKQINLVRTRISNDDYPEREFLALAGSCIGGFCLITPGFFTDLFGIICLMPFFRDMMGRNVINRLEIQTKELYEYLKLYEI